MCSHSHDYRLFMIMQYNRNLFIKQQQRFLTNKSVGKCYWVIVAIRNWVRLDMICFHQFSLSEELNQNRFQKWTCV